MLPSDNGLKKMTHMIPHMDISITKRTTVSLTQTRPSDTEATAKPLDDGGLNVRRNSRSSFGPPTTKAVPSRWRRLRQLLSFQRAKSTQRESARIEMWEESTPRKANIVVLEGVDTGTQVTHETRLAVEGMTCSACTSAIIAGLLSEPGIDNCEVTLLPPFAIVSHDPEILPPDAIKELIEDIGFEAQVVSSKTISQAREAVPVEDKQRAPTSYKAIYSVLGMTCAACSSSVTRAMESIPGATEVSVELMSNTGSVIVKSKEDAELVRCEVEDVGFECAVIEILEQHDNKEAGVRNNKRTVKVKVDGMFSKECVNKVNKSLESISQRRALAFTPISLDMPTTDLTYVPKPPEFTLRQIRDEVVSLGYTLSVVHFDSIKERAAHALRREQRDILIRFAVTFVFAIPTFVIAVVGTSFLGADNRFHIGLERPVWGNASCATVALFALATPVQFGVGWFFYKHSWKSLRGVWRKRRAGADWRKVWLERLFRWGSMDTLVALGTTIGYLASLALMMLDITTSPRDMTGGEMGWFDSSIFFMMFIFAGRYLESASKKRTGDAITALSSTKPSTGLLYTPEGSSMTEEPADFLEVGDILLVPVGASPPIDAVLTPSSPQTTFDESSLTGEARPVLKTPGDEVFAGTTNAGPAAAVVTVTKEAGKAILDGIVGIVRDAMSKKAAIERIVDLITGYFVPFVVGIAVLTFCVWCLRGYQWGGLPAEWLSDQRRGNWALFAVQFGVAVLVVACPCGIGLAAPTAQLVGVGLAAQNGILSNGGGEAFQTISSMTTVVLDKTGTLTTSKFTVSDHLMFVDSESHRLAYAMLLAAEQASTHPLAVSVREWCQMQLTAMDKLPVVALISSEEIPGRGLVAILVVDGSKVEVAIGNEKLMDDVQAEYKSHEESAQAKSDLLGWKMGGKSVIILSAKAIMESASNPLHLPIGSEHHSVLGLFGVHDPPRPEASTLVAELQRLNMDVWMISGDNETTARTVARSVGIAESHVVAGALPVDKLTWVKKLQGRSARQGKSWWRLRSARRNIVAFCGDGINDAPAIAQADVGLAMGGGSNVAVSTADFCLLSSNLLAIVTVHDVARVTCRKIITNVVWACLYNAALMPLAAGAFYALGRTRVPPVWGSAAMAFSSVSVVINSLFLRWTYRPPRVVRKWHRGEQV